MSKKDKFFKTVEDFFSTGEKDEPKETPKKDEPKTYSQEEVDAFKTAALDGAKEITDSNESLSTEVDELKTKLAAKEAGGSEPKGTDATVEGETKKVLTGSDKAMVEFREQMNGYQSSIMRNNGKSIEEK